MIGIFFGRDSGREFRNISKVYKKCVFGRFYSQYFYIQSSNTILYIQPCLYGNSCMMAVTFRLNGHYNVARSQGCRIDEQIDRSPKINVSLTKHISIIYLSS